MKKITTKDEIVIAAQKLFINRGIESVSMRDIAAELEISVGNLTYYFKKKEALAEEVVSRLFSDYEPLVPCKTLFELNDCFMFFEKLGIKNAFYFKNYSLFSRLSKKVRGIQKKVFDDNTVFWKETFSNLVSAGFMQPECFKGHFAAIAGDFHFIKIYWPDRKEAERNMGVNETCFNDSLWGIIFPLLTTNGKKVYLEKIKVMKEKI